MVNFLLLIYQQQEINFGHNMKRLLSIIIFLTLFVSCQNSNDKQKTSNNKSTFDSLSLEKEEKTNEAKELKSELDSLRQLRDSLDALTTGNNN